MSLHCCAIATLSLIACVTAFNVGTGERVVNVIERVEDRSAFSAMKEDDGNQSFFGYNIFVDHINIGNRNFIQLAVGAPLEMVQDTKSNTEEEDLISKEPSPQKRSPSSVTTPAMGVLYMCDVPLSQLMNRSGSRTHNCSHRAYVERHLSGIEISDRDGLGMTLVGGNLSESGSALLERNSVTTCAPLRQRECGTINKAEGACYTSKVAPGRGDSETIITWKKRVPCRESCISKNIDLMYVIDGSYSVGMENFVKVKNWIKEVTNGFDVTEQVQVGVVQYSYFNETFSNQRWIKTEIQLGKYKDKQQLDAAIDGIVYHGYKTYTAHAIIKTVRDDFNGPRNRFPKARRVMILLTDGRADDKNELSNATRYAVENGVESFAIGIGDYDITELNLIAGEDEDRVLTVDDFENLNEIVSRLQTDIQVLEGASSPDEHNGLSHCEAGISARSGKSGALYLGAVGAWDWSGTIVKYDNSEDEEPDIPDFSEVQRVLVNWTKESYLGYSLTSGFYNGGEDEYVAIGAPRYKLEGAVVIYRPRVANANFTDAVTIYPTAMTSQLGSYFGGSMLSVDLNADGRDDLLVGAPLYIEDNYDDGRVYVFISENSIRNPERWAESSYEPIVLSGKAPGGRFGTAIAAAGDLNRDGYNDVIIGAPYVDGERGAVYVYHGSSSGISSNPKQVIEASSLANENLKYFGLSIQGQQDLDGNGYPDIAVGAPKSDAVVIFRSRPVVTFSGGLEFSDSMINIVECFNIPGRNCLSVEVCLNAAGEGIEATIPVDFTILLDTEVLGRENKRVQFSTNAALTAATYEESGVLNVTRNAMTCLSYNVSVKQPISDYSTPIRAVVTYQVTASHSNQPLSSIRDPSLSNTFTATTGFERDCGEDERCNYDLAVDGAITLPPATLVINGTEKDLTLDGTRLVVSEQTMTAPIIVRVNLTNDGDNAFDVRVTVTYTNQLTWSNLGVIASSNPDPKTLCVSDSAQDSSFGSYRSRRLVYRYSSSLGSIMQSDQWCYFEFNLSSNSLQSSGTIPDVNVTVFAHTQNNGTADDVNPTDNTWEDTTEVRYRADADISERSIETVVPFNFTNENATIRSVQEIGVNTSNIQVQYEVNGRGYANVPYSTIALTFPFSLSEDEDMHLLYPVSYSCGDSEGSPSCVCDESVINPYNLLLNFPTVNDTYENNVTITSNPVQITQKTIYDCSTIEGRRSVDCRTFTCNITNLRSADVINFRVFFRLWSETLNLAKDTEVTFRSGFIFSTADSALLINRRGETVTNSSSSIDTIARLFTPPAVIEATNTIWIFIVAAVGGLLLLILIVIVLWKTGFFKSKYAEKKEALEWTEANQDESGSSMDSMKK